MVKLIVHCNKTHTIKDANSLYEDLVHYINRNYQTVIQFNTEVSYIFAARLLDLIYNSVIPIGLFQEHISFVGFKSLQRASLDNMKIAQTNILESQTQRR